MLNAVLAARRDVPLDAVMATRVAPIPLQRAASPADVAGMVAWLMSPDAAYVTVTPSAPAVCSPARSDQRALQTVCAMRRPARSSSET